MPLLILIWSIFYLLLFPHSMFYMCFEVRCSMYASNRITLLHSSNILRYKQIFTNRDLINKRNINYREHSKNCQMNKTIFFDMYTIHVELIIWRTKNKSSTRRNEGIKSLDWQMSQSTMSMSSRKVVLISSKKCP